MQEKSFSFCARNAFLIQETTISEVEGEEGNFLAGPEWKVAWFHPSLNFVLLIIVDFILSSYPG